ncbi:hypothetical protein PR048_019242 [Dryococelus australis]|uniref:Uncharacterized protein n=1 Tax=Dryococelus australis TaxID=614101 RepID=A0ABQ9H2Z6_9NEOP|nr:hypothetical protein PR048_019242 [Dryococelus australis]
MCGNGGGAEGGQEWLRSAPVRRLRHPLEESPVWGVLGSVLAGLLALVVGLPVVVAACVLVPSCLLARHLLLLLFRSRRSGMSPHRLCFSSSSVVSSQGASSCCSSGATTQVRHPIISASLPLWWFPHEAPPPRYFIPSYLLLFLFGGVLTRHLLLLSSVVATQVRRPIVSASLPLWWFPHDALPPAALLKPPLRYGVPSSLLLFPFGGFLTTHLLILLF